MCTTMEGDGLHRPPANDCPILCITKVVLYVLISMFILYLPLGDPSVRCASRAAAPRAPRASPAADCACQVYTSILNTSCRLGDGAQAVLAAARHALYHAKLQFYGLLDKLDKKDLCRVVCCSDAVEECCGASKDEAEGRGAACRGARKHCKKKGAGRLTRS